jgi:hypothetical protein
MQDFTITIYKQLLQKLISSAYSFKIFQNVDFHDKHSKLIVLRHDVDLKPENSLITAKIENEIGIKTNYYFRIVKESYNEIIIKKIADMGHEIGYHYEDLSLCLGNYEVAIKHFETNLEKFRKIYPVKTICMHGSPFSKWDNRDLWKKYDYRDFGVIAEPYFDVNFNDVLYLTDTGRRWDGDRVSIRDKVEKSKMRDEGLGVERIEDKRQGTKAKVRGQRSEDRGYEAGGRDHRSEGSGQISGGGGQEVEVKGPRSEVSRKTSDGGDYRFRHTQDIIDAAEKGLLPDKIMINTHPQRWTDRPLPWVKELVWQNMKNVAKICLNSVRR